ncbi:hypothetical protein [Salsipaludibacter albus]|uniref:hypothetical protein n=1 Tax=Salsipaludibacter albus TaxID=2849650 RepID=UPI001EE3D744|nr:hypothetical protein [Salsipaludibacter albus]MBY5162974.1 hypothetical protein [Salsipaludibacter albus]
MATGTRSIRFSSTGRWVLLALVATMVLLMVPTAGSSQTTAGPTLRMDVTTSQVTFVHTPASGTPTTQVGTPTRCELSVDGPLVALSGNRRGPGLSDNGLGIKSGGSQGTPCGRIDATEVLTLGLVGVPAASSAALDLELKGSARVLVEARSNGVLVQAFDVRAGGSVVAGQGVDGTTTQPFSLELTSTQPVGNCRNDSDAGPDSGPRDNCRVTIVPASPFDELTLTPVAGEVSLEGGNDFGTDPAYDTVFHLVTYDGLLGCDDGTDTASESDGAIVGTIIRYQNTVASDCVLKPYTMLVTSNDPVEGGLDSVVFEVDDPVVPAQAAIYEAFLTLDQPLNTPLDAVLEYDSDRTDGYTNFKQMPRCVQDPFTLDDEPTGSLNDEAIPAGHEGCVIDVTQSWEGLTTWHVVFAGDWKFRG